MKVFTKILATMKYKIIFHAASSSHNDQRVEKLAVQSFEDLHLRVYRPWQVYCWIMMVSTTMQPTRDMTLIWHPFHIFHRRYAHKSTRCAWTWLSFGGLPQASLCIGLTSRFTSQWSQWEGISVWGTTEHLRRHHFSYKVRLATCIPLLYQYDVISYNVGTTIINHK